MGIPIYQVDSFTEVPFRGNPAGVCILPVPRDAAWMQSVAAEMNLSETAFLQRREDGFDLRWFTPTVEVDLCGHATLASAHILWEIGLLDAREEARFHSRSGLLTARGRPGEIELDFPATPGERVTPPPGLCEAVGVRPRYVGLSRFDYLIEVETEQEVRALAPDFENLRTLGVRGVIVTAISSTPGIDFVSRFFAPGAGIDEDPVTGSAHCALGPFWSERLGKMEMIAYQASARGGRLRVRCQGSRVALAGSAVTVIRGELVDH
jgi:predicted PhzF superfamily epimerase YddE/YHI9